MSISGKRILLVDDDETQTILLKRVLETVGCETVSAETVKKAIGLLQKSKPDLVILDLGLPEHDGFSFLQFRKQNRILTGIPVLVLSGTKDPKAIQKAMEMGANQFLAKPLEARAVLQKIRYIFYNSKDLSYQFPKKNRPKLKAEVSGNILAFHEFEMKIDSSIRFSEGKPARISSKDFLARGGDDFVCKLANPQTEIIEGQFRSVLKVTGLSLLAKKYFERWQRNLK